MKNIFSSKTGIIVTGVIIGLTAVFLQAVGNPGNMGICVACFLRDVSGSLGLHRAAVVQYMRPEIIGLVTGALLAAFLSKEFRPRGGSSPLLRFALGFFAMTGALVFLGCPWRSILRLAGGDANAIIGIAGLACGIFLGTIFLKKGFTLGRSQSQSKFGPLFYYGTVVLFLILLILKTVSDSPLIFSSSGPGAMHAKLGISLAAGTLIGIIAQRSRFCTVGAFRDIFVVRQFHLFKGVAAFFLTVLAANLIFGKFHFGFENQPIAHSFSLWNFSGMLLAGLSFTLAGGCPGRQLILSGEGDTDSSLFVIGMIAGAAFAHNFSFAASPKGPGAYTAFAVVIGLTFCLLLGFFMKEKRS